MFDLRLTFSAGSSQDGDVPGLALLTNAMLNEGVEGKDVSAIARGLGLGADFGNGSYRDMAVVSLRSLSAPDKREPALALFSKSSASRPSRDSLQRIKNQLLAGFEFQKQNPGKLASLELFAQLYGNHPYAHPSEGTRVDSGDRRRAAARLPCPCLRGWKCGDRAGRRPFREEAEALAAQVSAALPQGLHCRRRPRPNHPRPASTTSTSPPAKAT